MTIDLCCAILAKEDQGSSRNPACRLLPAAVGPDVAHRGGPQMPFRSITADPAELNRLYETFDAAWTAVNAEQSIDPLVSAAQRERLGYIIVQLWGRQSSDLATEAVRRFISGEASGRFGSSRLSPSDAE